MKVFCWASDEGAMAFYRLLNPARCMRRLDSERFSIMISPEMNPNVLIPGFCDIVIGQRVCLRDASILWRNLCERKDLRCVYELDDDFWSIDPSNPANKFFDFEHRERARLNIVRADAVVVSTETLAEVVRPMNANVYVRENQVPEWLLSHQKPFTQQTTITYNGSTSHTKDFNLVVNLLRRLLAKEQDLRCTIRSGAKFAGRIKNTRQCYELPWVNSVENYLCLIAGDIGIAPLLDSTFNRSKSAIKALEYMALGIVPIVSDVEPYKGVVIDGKNGFVCSNEREWMQAFQTLIHDEAVREQMVLAGRETMASRTYEAHVNEWVEAWTGK